GEAAAFAAADQELRAAVAAMAQAAATEQAQPDLAPACRKVLESLTLHWEGLAVFVEHPEVPMDNNAAERAERGPVVGRKTYYGSGAVWAGQLAAGEGFGWGGLGGRGARGAAEVVGG